MKFRFKLLYQQMLILITMISSFLVIIGILLFHLTKENVYHAAWNQMEGYAQSIRNNALQLSTNNQGQTQIILNVQELRDSENLLKNNDVHFTIYTGPDRVLYPQYGFKPTISKKDWEKLQEGNIIKRRSDLAGKGKLFADRHQQLSKITLKQRMTDIFMPCFDVNGQLVAVISVTSAISNIHNDYRKVQKNLIIALVICMLIGFIISFLIANYITERIKKMQAATRQVADGNFNVQIEHGDQDELDELAVDFNQMSDSLQRSSDEIQRQEQRRKEFFANAAHEMRTPLTTINGLLEGLKYNAIPEEKRDESIDLMRSETKRLIRLVNDNLDYERIRSGSMKLNITQFDATETLNKIVSHLKPKAKEADDQIEIITKQSIPVYADYDRFTQIFYNIIQNAIQFTTNGKITIGINRDNGSGTEIKVSDTGIGMSQEQLDNIWERYYKADQSRARTKGESGLGLAIVHQLIQQHKGKIEVMSTEGRGTTFTLFFPDKDNIGTKK